MNFCIARCNTQSFSRYSIHQNILPNENRKVADPAIFKSFFYHPWKTGGMHWSSQKKGFQPLEHRSPSGFATEHKKMSITYKLKMFCCCTDTFSYHYKNQIWETLVYWYKIFRFYFWCFDWFYQDFLVNYLMCVSSDTESNTSNNLWSQYFCLYGHDYNW